MYIYTLLIFKFAQDNVRIFIQNTTTRNIETTKSFLIVVKCLF